MKFATTPQFVTQCLLACAAVAATFGPPVHAQSVQPPSDSAGATPPAMTAPPDVVQPSPQPGTKPRAGKTTRKPAGSSGSVRSEGATGTGTGDVRSPGTTGSGSSGSGSY